MNYLLFFLALVNLFLLWRLWRLRRFLGALAGQIGERRHYIFLGGDGWMSGFHLRELCQHINLLLDETTQSSRLSETYFNQIETTLAKLAEAVIIVNSEREIVLANPAAQLLLNFPRELKGQRLDTLVTSSSFMEYMEGLLSGVNPSKKLIELVQAGHTLYFEIVGAEVQNPSADEKPLTIVILHDITRMKRLERMRKDFVANVSHELRTPVTVIKGFTEVLFDDYDRLSDADRKQFFAKVHRNVGRLHALLDDLLQLSSLESGYTSFNPESLILNELVEEFADSWSDRVRKADIELLTNLDPGLRPCMVDRLKIHQVLHNLCDNVLRYAKGCTFVRIQTRQLADRVILAVEDDGCGIPHRDLERIFERFYRVNKGRTKDSGGTGLGLSIVKHIASLHGGDSVAFSDLGSGTRIELILPLPGQTLELQGNLDV